jgi:hypothetical protein
MGPPLLTLVERKAYDCSEPRLHPRSPRDGSEVQNPVCTPARRGSLVADSRRCVCAPILADMLSRTRPVSSGFIKLPSPGEHPLTSPEWISRDAAELSKAH